MSSSEAIAVGASGSHPSSALLVNTATRSFTQGLSLVRDELLRRQPSMRLAYFFRDSARLTPVQLAAQTHELMRMCALADIVLCETDCLPSDAGKTAPPGQRRVLILPPKAEMTDAARVRPAKALPYTDLVVQNERFGDYFSALYPSGGAAAVLATGLPIVDSFSSAAYRANVRERLYDVFPAARGRKIVALTMHFDARTSLGNVDLPAMAERLGREHFLLIHAPGLFPALATYDSGLASFVCNPEGMFTLLEVMAMADTLVSTRFGDAVYYSATGNRFVFFSRNPNTVPPALRDLMITRLDEIPRLLEDTPNSVAQAVFREQYVAPNVAGCAERLVDRLL